MQMGELWKGHLYNVAPRRYQCNLITDNGRGSLSVEQRMGISTVGFDLRLLFTIVTIGK